MTTLVKDVEKQYKRLGSHRDELLNEQARLQEDGERNRLRGDSNAAIMQRLGEIGTELAGLTPELKELRRVVGREGAQKMLADAEYQNLVAGAVAAFLEPLAALAAATDAAMLRGVGLVALPLSFRELIREGVSWVKEMIHVGAIDPTKLPPALRLLVVEGGREV